MRKFALPTLALVVLLAACQKPTPPVDYAPRFDALQAQLEESAARLDALAGDVDVLTTAVAGVKADVATLDTKASALTTVSEQVSGLAATIQRLDPANSAVLTINHAPGVLVTVTTGPCTGDLPPAGEVALATDTRSVSRLGLPPGAACLTSSDPPAQLEVQLVQGLQGVFFNPPPAEGPAE